MKNLFIFVADALRYDHLPESIAFEGSVMRGLAPSLHTPVCFSSMLTGRSPENHNVRGFDDQLSSTFETVFDRFENSCYYDYDLDPVTRTVLSDLPSGKELDEMDEPFIFVERAMETHTPYDEIHHGNEIENVDDGEYTRSFESSEELRDAYREGVEGVEEHFWNHIEELKELGLYEDTLVIFTSDHGELLGERINGRKRYSHSHPMVKQLVEVPVVFLNEDIETDHMRWIDLVETALGILDKEGLNQDGCDVREHNPDEGRVIYDGYSSFDTKWAFKDGSWKPDNSFRLKTEIVREDLRMLLNSKFDVDPFKRPGSKVDVKSEAEELEEIDF